MVYLEQVEEVENSPGIYFGRTERGRILNLKKLESSLIRHTFSQGITDNPKSTRAPAWACEWAAEEFKKNNARKQKGFYNIDIICSPVPRHLEVHYTIYKEVKNPFKN